MSAKTHEEWWEKLENEEIKASLLIKNLTEKCWNEAIESTKQNERKFKLVWKDGSENEVSGIDIATAMNNAGFGRGSLSALNYYEEI